MRGFLIREQGTYILMASVSRQLLSRGRAAPRLVKAKQCIGDGLWSAFVWTKRRLQWFYSILLSVYLSLISYYCEVDVSLCSYWTSQDVFSVGR